MTDRERDNLTREERETRGELRRPQAAPRRRGGARRLLRLLLVLLIVLGVVAAAAWKDLSGIDSLRRLFSYNEIVLDDQGKAERYSFSNDRSNTFALLEDALLVVSTTGVSLLGDDGGIRYSASVKLTEPAIALGGKTAAVYDVGGETLLVFSASGLVRDMSDACSGSILSVSVNSSDFLALNAEKSGYKSAVTVFDAEGTAVFAINSSERYIMDACVMSDCRHVAAVTLGEADGLFANTVTLYTLGSDRAEAVNTLTGSLLLSLDNVSGALACLTDESITLLSANGSLAGSYRFPYPHLRGAAMDGDGFAALLLGRYRSGSAMRLTTVSASGEELAALDTRSEVLSLSAAGSYVAVLYSDSLVIYDPQLTEYARLDGVEYAREVIMRADGTALLIGSSSAWLYIP